MFPIDLFYLSNEKDTVFQSAAAEYIKRLKGYCELRDVCLKEEKLPQNPTPGDIRIALEKEARCLLAKKDSRSHQIALCIEGNQWTSEQFAMKLQTGIRQGWPKVTFYIGSSHGLADMVKASADERLSLSMMTYPHKMARVMLLEQLYRAFQIIQGGKYHK